MQKLPQRAREWSSKLAMRLQLHQLLSSAAVMQRVVGWGSRRDESPVPCLHPCEWLCGGSPVGWELQLAAERLFDLGHKCRAGLSRQDRT